MPSDPQRASPRVLAALEALGIVSRSQLLRWSDADLFSMLPFPLAPHETEELRSLREPPEPEAVPEKVKSVLRRTACAVAGDFTRPLM